jgi:hypothetical protein
MFVATLGVNDHMTYDWIINFGATQHMTLKREWFTIYESIVPRKVYMGDDTILEAIGKGNNLITVNKLILKGLKVEFDKDGCKVNNVHGIVVVKACKEKNLYLLNVNVRKENTNMPKFLNEGTTLWHQRLGHFNMLSL